MKSIAAIALLFSSAQTPLALEKKTESKQLSWDLRSDFSDMTLSLSTRLAAPADDRHPFWRFEWEEARPEHTGICVVVLLLAALLCSAGGIGGGGVFVSVLMVVGRLSPRDAVPLSKAVVFLGSLSSLALNVGASLTGKSGRSRSVIDHGICRIVVPGSLTGTLLGVLINSSVADTIILTILVAILLAMSASAIWTTYTQFLEEESEAAGTLLQQAGSSQDSGKSVSTPDKCMDALKGDTEAAAAKGEEGDTFEVMAVKNGEHHVKEHTQPHSRELCASVFLLATVVINGVVRHHASSCLWELENGSDQLAREAACQHPTLYPFIKGHMEDLMGNPKGASWALVLTLALPICICTAAMLYSSYVLVRQEDWQPSQVLLYGLMSVATGIVAGLVGIGGGLIFAPFFLFTGVEPAVAVATSSTCVIFTSASTTLQYVLTDRVIMSLACVYGVVNLVGSYGGTTFVHHLQGRFATRRSYISGIVTVGVVLSAVLSMAKLFNPEATAH